MKKLLFIFFLIITFNLQSQNFAIVDSIVNEYPKSFGKPEKLAELIKEDFGSEKDKVRAVYSWITNNVSYSPKEYGIYSYEFKNSKEKKVKEEKYHSKLSKRVISKNIAVCEGYSSLFKKLCDLLNITSFIVNGASKVDIDDIGRRYNSNHTWNIVEINKVQYLIDATWGAGSYSNGFKEEPTDYYFFTNPNLFIKDHYPENYKYSLLDEMIDKQIFFNTPIIYKVDSKYCDIVSPKEGIIEINKSTNNVIKFKVFWKQDINSINYFIGRKNNSVQDYKLSDGILEFSIGLNKSQKRLKELIIYINNKPFLGYKLKQTN